MTREEASFILANIDRRVCDDELNEALDIAIKALEQQPCEDAVSRQAVLKTIQDWWKRTMMADGKPTVLRESIRALPPITLKQKTGHWIITLDDWIKWECSYCGYTKRTDVQVSLGYNYCPNCGAKMEREGKE